MKKLSILVALAAVVLGFSSCSEDRGPKYHEPTSFVLNQPPMMDQYIVLEEGNTLELTCSQPDYGYSAIANYSVEMAVSADFNDTFTLTPVNNHLAVMTIKQLDIATGLCAIAQIDSEDKFQEVYPDGMPFAPIYFRAVCELAGVAGSRIVSNAVQYNFIKGFFSVPTPGFIYLVGNVTDWKEPSEGNAAYYEPWRLFEDEDAIGSHIYSGDFELPDAPIFRFYTSLDGWGSDEDPAGSLGYLAKDESTDFPDWTGTDAFSQSIIKGKGAYNFPNFAGGKVHMVVNMSDEKNMIFEMTPVE